MTRIIAGLLEAEACEWPPGIPHSKPRGAKAKGVSYEKALGRALPMARRGQWWAFRDARGAGVCQTDILLERDAWALVLEAKYTWTIEGHEQLERLYLPVVEKALGKRVVGLVVCKKLIPEARCVNITGDFEKAVKLAATGRSVALQWLGVGKLWAEALGPRPGAVHPAHFTRVGAGA